MNMRHWIGLIESRTSRFYYHGSFDRLEVGTILTPRADYGARWGGEPFYRILEQHRPQNMLAHHEAVFMCASPDDLDAAGAHTEWLFTVRPLGPVQKHYMAWMSEINMALDDGASSEALRDLALRYWNGEASADPVWEFLTPKAEIMAVEEY